MIHPPIYGAGPFANYGNFERGLIAMINPCAVKGISIFLETAERLPEYEFGVVPGWGTTAADRRALERLPNVRFLPNVKDIDEVLARTRVLLNPSLWYEGFGLIVMEAMLRGIPVVASDSGGLEEAKRGHGVRDSGPDHRALRGGVRRALAAQAGAAGKRCRPMGGGAARAADRPRRIRTGIGGVAAGGRALCRAGWTPARWRNFCAGFGRAPRPAWSAATIESLSPERRALLLERLREAALMRILLAQNSLYYPAHGGGDKSNRLLMEALAARGHACRVVARARCVPAPGRGGDIRARRAWKCTR